MSNQKQVADFTKEEDIKDFLGIQVLTPAEEISVSGGRLEVEQQEQQQQQQD
ncbi:hypothetical protein [Chromobacterium vaccinii]|uniref:hypothetical protein n=1 Tax=Chromobacterium vaccinii TaxID=1108595 RepID=UPI000AEA0060|nr:hypothetical protein [Chromobacterium vaccinii]